MRLLQVGPDLLDSVVSIIAQLAGEFAINFIELVEVFDVVQRWIMRGDLELWNLRELFKDAQKLGELIRNEGLLSEEEHL